MNRIVTAHNIANLQSFEDFDLQIPNQCPRCHTALEPKHLESFYIELSNGIHNGGFGKLYSLYFCPKCENCFLAEYRVNIMDRGYQSHGWLDYLIPHGDEKTLFSDNINKLSPNFVKIYNQSENAESIGLTEICGIGYRKSLEFLVKDFAIATCPGEEDKIKSKLLSPCIQEYIDNGKLRNLALASAWLGNDETHYVRKHEDYDVSHLKVFINAAVSYIDFELSSMDAEKLLNKTIPPKP